MIRPLPCPPEDWPAFSRLLDEALALPTADQAHWLASLPPQAARLRPSLEAVLARAGPVPGQRLLEAPRLSPDLAHTLQPGQRIGPYTLVAALGEGGMGSVWRARRSDGAYVREVALKLPHAHLLAGSLAQRFARERDILAGLLHPHIAHFLDAGLAEDGRPYLALELVEGVPITTAVREQGLNLRARLALFLQVLSAVVYAHGRLVAHRDIKPANVLVTGDGQAKLLDFGIAKLLLDDNASAGLTRESPPATPRYAAPEQRQGGAVTTATDVYALGLLLHEVLTDAPAWPEGRPSEPQDPPLPSQRAPSAEARRALQGDLDAIVHRALQPEPGDRYGSAQALADDIRRYLSDLPIQARHIPPWARGFKWIRRHRLPAALAAALLVSLVSGLAGVAWQYRQALQQTQRAEAVKGFLVGVFRHADPRLPSDQPRGTITARQLLDAAVDRLDTDVPDNAALRVELLALMTEIYGYLEEEERFQHLHQRWLALAETTLGPHHPLTLEAQLMGVWALIYQDDHAQARQRLDVLHAQVQAAGLSDSLTAGRLWLAHGEALKASPGQREQRLQALQKAEDLLARHAPRSGERMAALANMGNVHLAAEQWSAARDRMQQALALASPAPDVQENVPVVQANLGMVLVELGDAPGALALYEQSAAQTLRMWGRQHASHAHAVTQRARLLHRMGRRDEALALWEGLALAPSPEADPWHANAREHQAAAWLAEGRAAAALPLLQAVERRYRTHPGRESDVRRLQGLLGLAWSALGRPVEAQAAFQAAWQGSRLHDAPGSAAWLLAHERWARWLLDQGQVPTAAGILAQVPESDAPGTSLSQGQAQVLLAVLRARLALAQDDGPAAEAASRQAHALWQALPAPRELRLEPYLLRIRAEVAAHGQRADEARALRQQAESLSRQLPASSDNRALGL